MSQKTRTQIQQMRIDSIPLNRIPQALSTAERGKSLILDLGTLWVSVKVAAIIPKLKVCAYRLCKKEFTPTTSKREYCDERCRRRAKWDRYNRMVRRAGVLKLNQQT